MATTDGAMVGACIAPCPGCGGNRSSSPCGGVAGGCRGGPSCGGPSCGAPDCGATDCGAPSCGDMPPSITGPVGPTSGRFSSTPCGYGCISFGGGTGAAFAS